MLSEKKRGRPRKQARKRVVIIKLVLREGEDDDLIALFSRPGRAKLVRALARGSNLQGLLVTEVVTKEEMFAAFSSLFEEDF
jgi:hypothetical protein